MKYYFKVSMSADDVMPYYRGQASTVVAFATNGQRIQFPAMHLRKFMTPSGVYGMFCLETENNKFVSLTKVS
ncbi:DUF2835 domain-containing protein [Thalassotalea euphylliae]|uniref:DUF2835 family protein n=1 Tax=Thalassotalea euphylliae TaxID=1655234 RepID=A0A3E0UFI2_9GAMM|nr:DUF2835 domain-containing protein [Thalassotalea euphylliae]REL35781.1 DUF2835 family protein [Thalassotalea euphylliae]